MEFRFNVGRGWFRHFLVEADNEKQAKERFEEASRTFSSPTCGFQLKDISSIQIVKKEIKC